MFTLTNQTALITGAASGLGKAIALAFANAGAHVILSDINQQGLADTAAQINQAGGTSAIHVTDLGQHSQVQALIDNVLQHPLDILVCCGGMEGHVGALANCTTDDWNTLFNVNLHSAHQLTAAIGPAMKKRNQGRIIYIGSIAGSRGNRAIGLYGVAKAALSQLARNYAVEFGQANVTVNCIAPGLIDTPLSKNLQNDPAFMERRLQMTPLRRVGKPEEIAGTALYLASSAGGFTTGQTIVVDGGTLITDGS